MSDKYTISKSTVECYKIRHTSGMYWADISVDANGKQGRITIASDFGSWQNYWGACGSNFKEFLCGLDQHYVAGKFGADKHFDADATVKSYRETMATLSRRDKDIVLLEINHLADNYAHKDEFMMALNDMPGIKGMYEGCPDFVYTITPGFKQFWEKVWPVFVEELKKEKQDGANNTAN